MNYSIAKFKAQLFANERNISVYIAKSYLTEDYCLLFDKKQKPTPHFQIIEKVRPCNIKGFCGKIAGNITNGDVIKAMFPKAATWVGTEENIWWNAPYKAESEE